MRYRLQQGQAHVAQRTAAYLGRQLLLLTSDVSLKVKLFTVGFHSLLTDFVIANTGHDRSGRSSRSTNRSGICRS